MFQARAVVAGLMFCASAFGGVIDLTDSFIHINGSVYQLGVSDPPGLIDLSGFSPSNYGSPGTPGSYTGLGTITASLTAPGAYSLVLYLDHDLNNLANGAFNEYGATSGSPLSGVSWQLGDANDTSGTPSDIFTQAANGTITNANTVGTPTPPPNICCSVAMAIGIAVTLGPYQTAVMTFTTSTVAPTGGFYLAQYDVPGLTNQVPDLTPGDAVYLQGAIEVTDHTPPIPEPGTIVLAISGLLAARFVRRRFGD